MSIKKGIQGLRKWILDHVPLKNHIVFESYPVYADNTKAVYDEMVRQGLHKKYKFFWLYLSRETIPEGVPHAKFVKYPGENWLKNQYVIYLLHTARALISCNEFLFWRREDQYAINLTHGAALKRTTAHYKAPDEIDEFLTFSTYLAPLEEDATGCAPEKMRVLGFPRNDILLNSQLDVHKLFPDKDFKKLIYWMPTYRQHNGGAVDTSSITLPIIYNEAIAEQINVAAREAGVLVVLKPHFAQDVSRLMKIDLSNLVFINDAFLRDNHVLNYEFLAKADALLTDYSSVYYDYLLTNRPIGLCWDDYEEFSQREGLVVDVDEVMAGGEKIYTPEDLCGFITRLAAGEDRLQKERREVFHLLHDYPDGESSRRVVEHIKDKLAKQEAGETFK